MIDYGEECRVCLSIPIIIRYCHEGTKKIIIHHSSLIIVKGHGAHRVHREFLVQVILDGFKRIMFLAAKAPRHEEKLGADCADK